LSAKTEKNGKSSDKQDHVHVILFKLVSVKIYWHFFKMYPGNLLEIC